MWTETKHGLHKQFVFADFQAAWNFMQEVSELMCRLGQYPRWQNEWNVVEFWLSTHEPVQAVTDKDWQLAQELDAIAMGNASLMASNDEKRTVHIKEVQLYADGGSRGNPGPSASGFVVLDMSGTVIHAEGIYLGITTNNQAEYQALKLGLEAALRVCRAQRVHVYMDSLLVVNQMKRIFKVKNRDLWPIHDAIRQLLPQFEKVTFDHVPRELNRLADAEVNKCLDAEQDSQVTM